MTRIFGQNVAPEMLVLWLLETAICFVMFYVVLAWAGPLASPLAPPLVPLGAASLVPSLGPSSVILIDDAGLLAMTVGLVGFALGLYRPEVCLGTRRLLVKAVVAAAASLPAVWLMAKVAHIDLAGLFGRNPLWPVEALLTWAALLLATRFAYVTALDMDLFVRRVVVIGEGPVAARTAAAVGGLRRSHFRIETAPGFTALAAGPRPWGVILANPATPGQSAGAGMRVLDAASFWERQLGRIDLATARPLDFAPTRTMPTGTMPTGTMPTGTMPTGTMPTRTGAESDPAWARSGPALLRRAADIVLASLLLLLTAPLMLATAFAIRLDSRGPVIYRQERVGLGGRAFTLMKFRSMRTDAERAGPAWAAARDSRVTRVGRVIRKIRIDELPQLLNILTGEMSLVGPRPERPHFVEQLAEAIPLYRERAHVKPGLTGWAQVNYPYGASVEDARMKLSYDLYYVKHRSLLLDLLILLATVRVILFQEGAR